MLMQALQIGALHHAGIRHQVGPAFQIDKAHRTGEIKFHFPGIQQMEKRHFMPAKTKMLQRIQQVRRRHKPVRQHHHHRPALCPFSQTVQRLYQRGFPFGFHALKQIKIGVKVRGCLTRRQIDLHPRIAGVQPHRIPLLHQHIRQMTGDIPGVIKTGALFRFKRHRPAGIQHHVTA